LKTETLEVRADWNGTHWVIKELGNTAQVGLKADALVMRATHEGRGFAEGYIVSIHGLDPEVASQLNNALLRLLGVGAQFRPQSVAPKWARTRRVNLTASGLVTGGAM
jgi:hypothetical protein